MAGKLSGSQAIEQPASALRTRQGPSADDWERLRPIIRQLYIVEDGLLKDVISTMARVYGHKAS
jgi:hypothetical protein